MSLLALRGLWRKTPEPFRRGVAPLVNVALESYVRAAARAGQPAEGPRGPIRIVGFFSSAHGIAASAKLAARAFEALGAQVERVDVTGARLDWTGRLAEPTPASAWIFHMNPPEMLAALATLGPRRLVGPRYGYWAWELPRAPRRWIADANLVDEVWAPSRYTAEAFAGARAPVRVVPHPLFLEDYADVAPAPRRPGFQAVTLFDFNSSAARKNPLGAIAAFRRAFGDDPACELVIKTQNGAVHPHALARLRDQAGPGVRIVDETWPYGQVKALIAGADALLSLHRAEGFGLTVAEAMALGTPVVATAATGVTDFFDESCGVAVPWSPTPVDDPQGIYRGQTWAEPDLDAASVGLRRLRDEPEFGRRLAEAGRVRVAERLSPKAWLATLPPSLQAAVAAAGR